MKIFLLLSLIYTLLFAENTSAQSVSLLKDFNTGPAAYNLGNFASYPMDVNGTMFFNGQMATTGLELWKSDGTAAGTVMVKDINVGEGNGGGSQLININGYELWKSDGSATGTVMVKDIFVGLGNSMNFSSSNFTVLNLVIGFVVI